MKTFTPHFNDPGFWTERMGSGSTVPRPGPVHGGYPLKDAAMRSHSPFIAWLQAWWRAAP